MKKYSLLVVTFMLMLATTAFTQSPVLSTAEIDTPRAVADKTNFFQAGSFYFGGQPDEEMFRKLADEGVTIVINLRTDDEMDAYKKENFDEVALLQDFGISYVHIPLGGKSGYSADAVDQLEKTLSEHQGKALIHCKSCGRVSFLWVAYLIKYRNYTIDDAINIGKKMNMYFPPLSELLGYELTIQKKN
jgi:uncharacterized protein (TIGR01244 family)